MIKQYFYNLFVLFSKIVNTFIGGSPHETLSMALGRAYLCGTENKFTLLMVNIVNWIFATLFKESNHVQLAYLEKENKARSLWGKN